MIEDVLFYGNLVLSIVIIVNVFIGIILAIRGLISKNGLINVIEECNRNRKEIDEKFFPRWEEFLGSYQNEKKEFALLSPKIVKLEKEFFSSIIQKHEKFENKLNQLKIFTHLPDIKKGFGFKRKIKKYLKTKIFSEPYNIPSEKRKNRICEFKFHFLNVDLKKVGITILKCILISFLSLLCLGILEKYKIEVIFLENYLFYFKWEILIIPIIIACIIIIKTLRDNIFLNLSTFILINLKKIKKNCILILLSFLGIFIMLPAIINFICFVLNNKDIISISAGIFNIIFLLLAFFVFEIFVLRRIKQEIDKVNYEKEKENNKLNDLSNSEKYYCYEKAFENDGDLDVFLENLKINVNEIKNKIKDFSEDKELSAWDQKEKDNLINVYFDYKILESIFKRPEIENEYYNGFESIKNFNENINNLSRMEE